MNQESKFKQGQKVKKNTGYKYPGVVVAVFKTLKGKIRYVVECTVPEVEGMLHIYSEENLEATENGNLDPSTI